MTSEAIGELWFDPIAWMVLLFAIWIGVLFVTWLSGRRWAK